jgi:hypothetical protein
MWPDVYHSRHITDQADDDLFSFPFWVELLSWPTVELTCGAGIQLNDRISLKHQLNELSFSYRAIFPVRTHTKARSLGDHITSAALFG